MPLFSYKHLPPDGEVAIWNIREDEDWFRENLSLFPEEEQSLAKIKGKGRRIEWLAARYLLHKMSMRQVRGALVKDEYGKPRLEDSDYEISLSHSAGMAAAIAGKTSVGIDIQVFVPRIDRLAHKYMRAEEFASLEVKTFLRHLHIYWCAKEALFKIYGRKQIDFKKNLLVEPFAFSEKGGAFQGRVLKDDFDETFQLFYEVNGNHFLVYGG